MFRVLAFSCVAFLAQLASANATIITYTATDNGGSNFTLDFSVKNDTLGTGIEEFTIFFDLGVFENILAVSAPADWDPFVAQPDPGIPDDGFADWLAFGLPITNGETLSGFMINLDVVSGSLPMQLFFSVVDPLTFNDLDTGFATLNDSAAPVPLPGAALFFVTAGVGLIVSRARKKNQL